MKLSYVHSNSPDYYIRIDIYNLVIWLDDPTDNYLRPWAGKRTIQEMLKISRKYYETISNT